jgi:hypothetical protein
MTGQPRIAISDIANHREHRAYRRPMSDDRADLINMLRAIRADHKRDPELTIKFLTGLVPSHDRPSICHSGKQKRRRCSAVSTTPGRDGWVFVVNPPQQGHRDGWWCPDCVRQFREAMGEQGIEEISAGGVVLLPPGTA